MRRRLISLARAMAGVGLLVFVVVRVGMAPFADALDALRWPPLVSGIVVGSVTTLLCAWRWREVASSLGMPIPVRVAIAAYYQSQFLDATLPGGVLGDVDRGVWHGRHVGAVGRGLRAVVWERCVGQVVQLGLTVMVLLVLPSPLRAFGTAGVVSPIAVVIVGGLVGREVMLRHGSSHRDGKVARAVQALGRDLRDIAGATPASLFRVTLASAGAVTGHAAVFVIAARANGVALPLDRLLPLTLAILVASGLPVNIAGWGPREGAAAWVFSTAGLGAAQGVTTAVTYGVIGLIATLPGAIVLVAGRPRHLSPTPRSGETLRMTAAEVDAYLAELDETKRSTLQAVRRSILQVVPHAEEGISYSVPAFRVDGKVVAGFAAFKNHLAYLPHSGEVFDKLGDVLSGYAHTSGSLHFPVDEPLPDHIVRSLVEAKLDLLGL